jgi:hypothetical protein
MHFNKVPGNFHMIYPNVLRFCPSCLASEVSKVRTKNSVSVVDILHSDRAIGNKFLMHHPRKFLLGRIPNNPLEPSCLLGRLDLMSCVAFKVSSNGIHQHVFVALVLLSFFEI